MKLDKALLLVLFPFFTLVLIIGFVAFYARSGRPIKLSLKGLGISFELTSSDNNSKEERP